jgi:hypothetical protein
MMSSSCLFHTDFPTFRAEALASSACAGITACILITKTALFWGDDLESGTHKFLITREQTKQYLVYCSKFGTSSRIVAEVFSLQLAVLNL